MIKGLDYIDFHVYIALQMFCRALSLSVYLFLWIPFLNLFIFVLNSVRAVAIFSAFCQKLNYLKSFTNFMRSKKLILLDYLL